jgi:predicted metal-dependent phosphoesterase TrpH/ABC-type lipoprotein export system ATPase subunit
MTNNTEFPGSRWWKFDIHTHTPMSEDYLPESIEPETWLQKAMESSLDCVAVTDHNSGAWIDTLKSKYEELQNCEKRPGWFKELIIFPGVEIAIVESSRRVHLLAVFDPKCDANKITSFLGSCGINSGFGDSQNTYTTLSIIEVIKRITDAGGIAIPAHVDILDGLFYDVTLKLGLNEILRNLFVAEFRYSDEIETLEQNLKIKVNKLAKIAGSDAHSLDNIGKHFSWLKMSRPTIEALKLALYDHEFCLLNQSDDPNKYPNIFLSKLTISKMRHCGKPQPLIAELNPFFNSIIGGRGTGKSTLIESIRLVTQREGELVTEDSTLKKDLDKFMSSAPEGVMQDNTEILLELHRHGKEYQLIWRYDGQGAVLEEKINKSWRKIEPGNLSERFPISIYSQKQIHEFALNTRGLLDNIDRSPEVNKAEWESRWKQAQSSFLQLCERRRDIERQLAGEQQLRVKLSDVENDLKQYEEKGHGEILKQFQKRSQQKNGLPDNQIFDDISTGIRALAANAEFYDFPDHLFDEQDDVTAEMREIHEQSSKRLNEIAEALGKLADQVDGLKTERIKNISSSKWYQALKTSTAAYEGLIKEYEGKQSHINISTYGDWVQQRSQLDNQLKKIDSFRKEYDAINMQIKDLKLKFQELRNELTNKRTAFLNRIIGENNFVRMELVQYGDVSTLERDYRSMLYLDGDVFENSLIGSEIQNGTLWELINWKELDKDASELPHLVSTINSKIIGYAKGKDNSNQAKFDSRLKALLETNPSCFDRLETWWPEDLLQVKFSRNDDKKKFEALEKGSAGQKAAAILAFLLSHGDEPLIIDQPEDDLDNALIYDLIVKQIHANKRHRQLIIATHNPNIVVNGDSELIHVMKFTNGQVQFAKEGGLEEPAIREAICTIMEGGHDAFEKRYQRITMKV